MLSQTARGEPVSPLAGSHSTTDFVIEGMTCASCVARVEKAIRAVPGVTSANVNLATEKATVSFSDLPKPEAVVAAIEKAGYTTREETLELQIEGMTCASCVARIEKAVVLHLTARLRASKIQRVSPASNLRRCS